MPKTVLQDEKELIDEDEESTLQLWLKRYKEAENFRKPIDERNLRMYKLYRGYRDWLSNYAYNVNLMPPIGFEVIETVKPRLAAAKINTRILPTKKEDVTNPSLKRWDNLIHYQWEVMDFDNKKIEWIDSQLKFGNGTAQLYWDNEDPGMEICDNWLLYMDPQTKGRGKGARWIIKRSWKEKEILQDEEKGRDPEDKLYDEVKLASLENAPVKDDPRRDRRDIMGKKMGQINDGLQRDDASDAGPGDAYRDHSEYKAIEILECYDFIKQEIVTIGNRERVIRQDPNDYAEINKQRNPGNLFIDLVCTPVPWEYYGIPLLEPVETTIYEIADSRNQAMDNIVLNLDPITKVKKGAGYKLEDFKKGPGAVWFVKNENDVIVERPTDIGTSWIEKDEILRREIQTSLALSEYTQGMPQSAQEPMGKVELLLMQTNIRFSSLVRQMQNSFTDMVNIMIELNQSFLDQDKAYRIAGEDFDFDEFTEADKQVYIDAKIDIIPKKEKSAEQESLDAFELYKMFVLEDPPNPEDPEELYTWKKKKAELQRMILEKMGYEEYEDLLVTEPPKPQPQMPTAMPESPEMPQLPPDGLMEPNIPEIGQMTPEIEPLLPIPGEETGMVPGASTELTEPSPGFIQGLLNRVLKRQ